MAVANNCLIGIFDVPGRGLVTYVIDADYNVKEVIPTPENPAHA